MQIGYHRETTYYLVIQIWQQCTRDHFLGVDIKNSTALVINISSSKQMSFNIHSYIIINCKAVVQIITQSKVIQEDHLKTVQEMGWIDK